MTCRLRSRAVIWSISKPDVEFQYGGRLREFYGLSSQSHLPHCRVLPPGEFNVIMPELCHTAGCCHLVNSLSWFQSHMPHIAGCRNLVKSMSWSCHIAGCNNSIRHIENRFSPYFILFYFILNAVWGLWRAVAFASSPIHHGSLLFTRFSNSCISNTNCPSPTPNAVKILTKATTSQTTNTDGRLMP